MNIINTVLGIPLGYIMYFCYLLTKNYGAAIILFTLVSKVILFPISLMVQKNSVRMVKIQPVLDEIKLRYAGDKDRIAEEQIKLYGDEKYSPAMGCLPTLIQIPLILGLINVIYNPLQHLLRLSADTIQPLIERTSELLHLENLGYSPQLRVVEAVHDPALSAQFGSLSGIITDFGGVISQVRHFDLSFVGFNLSMIPSIANPTVEIFFAIISGLSALALCITQNKISVLQREQPPIAQWGMTIFMVAFSTYFAFIVPCGVALYWAVGNLSSILVLVICNIVYNPHKYIDYENRPKKGKLSSEQKAEQARVNKINRAREMADSKRFNACDGEGKLVFYSAKNGFYKYFENVIEYILSNSDIPIHYITSDPEDAIFRKNNPQIIPYYIGGKALIPFMMKMDADVVVMTMPDLQKYHVKRSLVRKDIEYVYMFHAITSTHLGVREGAYDHFDTIFCVGQHHIDELRETERIYNLPAKNLIPCGYGLIDNLIASYERMPKEEHAARKILVAPSWQQDNILETCLDDLVSQLYGEDHCIIIRPHPEFIKRFPDKMRAILSRYENRLSDYLIIETDFSSNVTIFTADLLVTDWSGIAYEFSFATEKPSLFVNTPMKVMNPEYQRIPLVPTDISLRDEVGISVKPEDLSEVSQIVKDLLENQNQYSQKIRRTRDKTLFNIGHSGEAGGKYIIETLNKKAEAREDESNQL